jgi:hypothetical protein
MEDIFGILILISLTLLVIGVFSPRRILFWLKKEQTRKKSLLIYGTLFIISFVLFGINPDTEKEEVKEVAENSTKSEEDISETPEKRKFRTELKEEFPKELKCTSDLGVLKFDENAHPISKNNHLKELLKHINADCDIIEISYEMLFTPIDPVDDKISKKIVYNKKTRHLKDIYTENNVIEDYKGVDFRGLRKFLIAGKRVTIHCLIILILNMILTIGK